MTQAEKILKDLEIRIETNHNTGPEGYKTSYCAVRETRPNFWDGNGWSELFTECYPNKEKIISTILQHLANNI